MQRLMAESLTPEQLERRGGGIPEEIRSKKRSHLFDPIVNTRADPVGDATRSEKPIALE